MQNRYPDFWKNRCDGRIPAVGIIILIVLFLVGSIGGILAWRFSHMQNHWPEMAAVVKTTPVQRRAIPIFYETFGMLEAENQVDLNTEVPSVIRRIQFKEGQWVSQGAVLFQLDNDRQSAELQEAQTHISGEQALLEQAQADFLSAEAALASAEANRKLAQADFVRYQQLLQKEFVTLQEFEAKENQYQVALANSTSAKKRLESAKSRIGQVESQVRSARARFQVAETNLGDFTIQAPFAGQVGKKFVDVGDYVAPTEKLVTLVQTDPLQIVFQVPERFIAQLETGQPVEFITESFPGIKFQGKVAFVDPVVSLDTRSVLVKALIHNSAGHIKPGQSGNIRIIFGERENALVVPEESIIPQGEQYFVYAVQNGKAHFRPVKIGQRLPGWVEIMEGLSATERVVVAGIQKVRDEGAVEEQGIPKPGQSKPGQNPIRVPKDEPAKRAH